MRSALGTQISGSGRAQSRAVVLRLACLGLLASSKEDGFRPLFLRSEGEGRMLRRGAKLGTARKGLKSL